MARQETRDMPLISLKSCEASVLWIGYARRSNHIPFFFNLLLFSILYYLIYTSAWCIVPPNSISALPIPLIPNTSVYLTAAFELMPNSGAS